VSHDRSSYTTDRELLGLTCAAPSKLISRGAPGEVRKFTAIAVFDSVPLDGQSLDRFVGDLTGTGYDYMDAPGFSNPALEESTRRLTAEMPWFYDTSNELKRYSVPCKIVAASNGKRFRAYANVHNFLGRCGEDERLDHLYVDCITASNNFCTSTYIVEGDELLIECRYDRYGKLDQSSGRVIKIKKKNGEYGFNGIRCAEADASLIDMF
jgi:hypothetical protein